MEEKLNSVKKHEEDKNPHCKSESKLFFLEESSGLYVNYPILDVNKIERKIS